jgi:hypothetical protein
MTTYEYHHNPPSLWGWFSGQGDPVLATSRLTVILSTIVIFSAGILGFTALRDLFISIGLFHPILGYLFPILFDAAEIAFAVSALNAQLQGEEDGFAWSMVVLFTLLGILANIAHAIFAGVSGHINSGQVVLAVIFTSLFPLSVALVTHNLKNSIKRQIKRNAAIKTLIHMMDDIRQAKSQLDILAAQQAQTEAERSALAEQKAQLEQEISALKKERRAAKRGTQGSGEANYTEPSPDSERQAYDILAEQVRQGKRNQEINGTQLGREIGTSASFGRRLKNRLLPQVRQDLDIPEPEPSSNGSKPTN